MLAVPDLSVPKALGLDWQTQRFTVSSPESQRSIAPAFSSQTHNFRHIRLDFNHELAVVAAAGSSNPWFPAVANGASR